MRLRFLTSFGVLAVVTAAVSLLAVSVAGQAPSAAAKTATSDHAPKIRDNRI